MEILKFNKHNMVHTTEDGVKIKCSVVYASYTGEELSIYPRHSMRFPKEFSKVFTIENNTNSMTDYFEDDRIFLKKDHKHYTAAFAAFKGKGKKSDAKVTSVRELSMKLDSGVSESIIGKNLSKRVALWMRRKEIKLVDGVYYLYNRKMEAVV